MALLSKGLPRALEDLYHRVEALEQAVADAYTDTDARNAIKTKTQIAALTSESTTADIVTALKA